MSVVSYFKDILLLGKFKARVIDQFSQMHAEMIARIEAVSAENQSIRQELKHHLTCVPQAEQVLELRDGLRSMDLQLGASAEAAGSTRNFIAAYGNFTREQQRRWQEQDRTNRELKDLAVRAEQFGEKECARLRREMELGIRSFESIKIALLKQLASLSSELRVAREELEVIKASLKLEKRDQIITPYWISEEPDRPVKKIALGATGKRPGYTKIGAAPGADIQYVADPRFLGLPAGSLDEIFSVQRLESLSDITLAQTVLPHWFSLLANGGTVRIVERDWERTLEAYRAGTLDGDQFLALSAESASQPPAMRSKRRLVTLLAQCGFTEVSVRALTAAESSGASCSVAELEIVARKPALTTSMAASGE